MKLPFFDRLDDARVVLVAGAGGGFDIFAGLPLFFWLRAQGKTVHLANLSFTDLSYVPGNSPVPSLTIIDSATSGPSRYFPESHLCAWLEKQGINTQIHAIIRGGQAEVGEAYRWMESNLRPDTIILVDGGTDILMRGDEFGLGTPQEDIASLAAVNALGNVARKLIACLGFGVDTYHGVSHANFLENVATLIGDGGFLGSWSLMREMPEFQRYEEACEYTFARMPQNASIVNSSIVAAGNGWFGNRHPTKRTKASKLFLNPLMTQYWTFDLPSVAGRNLYLDQISNTATYRDLSLAIEKFRATLTKQREWQDIPF